MKKSRLLSLNNSFRLMVPSTFGLTTAWKDSSSVLAKVLSRRIKAPFATPPIFGKFWQISWCTRSKSSIFVTSLHNRLAKDTCIYYHRGKGGVYVWERKVFFFFLGGGGGGLGREGGGGGGGV